MISLLENNYGVSENPMKSRGNNYKMNYKNIKKWGDDENDELSPKYADDFLNVYEESLSAAAQGHYNPLTPEEIDEFGLDFDFSTMYECDLVEYEEKIEELNKTIEEVGSDNEYLYYKMLEYYMSEEDD